MADKDYQRIRRKFDINYYEDCLKANRRAQKKRCLRDPEYLTKSQLKRNYDMTLDEYNTILASQDSRCAICGMLSEENDRRLAIDHDHKTGRVRGLLCTRCNMGLGYFTDSPKLLREAAAYLEKFERLK